MAPRAIEQLVDRIGHATWLDQVAKPVSAKVAELVPGGRLKDLLSGTWLGHPLHPMLTDLPIGFWTSAMAVDFLGGRKGHKAADRLVALGVLSALPTAAAGLSDWSDTIGEERRLGFAHAAGNLVALDLYAWSWIARKRGRRGTGVALSVLGAAAATAGAYLGGHLAWRRGVNVDRHAWDHPSDGWVEVTLESPLEDGVPVAVAAGGDTVLVVRTGGAVHALSDLCSHMGGPLHEGSLADGCITCPWHGSTFRLTDGEVVHGPATGPQPGYDVRQPGDDRLELRRRPLLAPAAVAQVAPPEGNGQDAAASNSSTAPAGAAQA